MGTDILISDFHVVKYSFDFFQPCKSVKTIFSTSVVQKGAVGQIWP